VTHPFENEASQGQHGLILEAGASERAGATGAPAFPTRFESIGVKLPERVLTTRELMASTRHRTSIDLERLTGIRQRHVCCEGEDSYTLAVDAARDCLARSHRAPADIEMLISTSITRYKGGLRHQWEPPLSLAIKQAIGAPHATSFDLSNACAGMMSGAFILHDFIRRGVIRCGMVVSGEYISSLSRNAARQIRWILSPQLASLTLGDAGAAVIVERADPAADPDDRIAVAGFATLSEHSRLCIGAPSSVGPGASMYTKARTIHSVAIAESPPLLQEALAQAGLGFGDIDYVIPHQTSARAIEKGTQAIAERLGVAPKHVVVTVDELGNTSSTTHFLALHKYLREHRFEKGDLIMLISFASGLEVGVMIFAMGELVDRYGRAD
jgi:3-oxoacyl-[acyl-carrier-protein] synthase-3